MPPIGLPLIERSSEPVTICRSVLATTYALPEMNRNLSGICLPVSCRYAFDSFGNTNCVCPHLIASNKVVTMA